jgi:hypothetical protein
MTNEDIYWDLIYGMAQMMIDAQSLEKPITVISLININNYDSNWITKTPDSRKINFTSGLIDIHYGQTQFEEVSLQSEFADTVSPTPGQRDPLIPEWDAQLKSSQSINFLGDQIEVDSSHPVYLSEDSSVGWLHDPSFDISTGANPDHLVNKSGLALQSHYFKQALWEWQNNH